MTYKKKTYGHQLWTHDPFSDNPKIWPTFISRGEVPAHTFAKLPVSALINDPGKKTGDRHLLQPMTHFFTNHKFDLAFIRRQFFKSSCACCNSWPTKKKPTVHQLGPMTHFLTTPKCDLSFYIQGRSACTHVCKASCECPNLWPTKKLIQTSTTTHDPFFYEPSNLTYCHVSAIF